MKIECPYRGGQAEICAWQQHKGQVRDFSKIGVVQCAECKLVTHAKDLSGDVNYESGSMHNWASRKVDSILDFGCGSGGMLSALANSFSVFGIEPDSVARDTAIHLGHEVFESAEIALANKVQVDMVTLFHVVEHFYEPSTELNRILELLRPGGIIVIETPNSMDALLSKYESEEFSNFTYWSHHPMLHSHRSLEKLVERCGYKIVENSGVQRYDLNNHLYWLSHGRPGGHEVWKDFSPIQTNEVYAKHLIGQELSDTLWMVACKP